VCGEEDYDESAVGYGDIVIPEKLLLLLLLF